jgi:hypothetical protein
VLESVGSFAWLFWIFGTAVGGEPSDEIAATTSIAPSMQFVLGVLVVLTLISGYFAGTWMG